MKAVGVIGSGAWGTTLALLLARNGVETVLWEHRKERAALMEELRENRAFLPGIIFPSHLHVTAEIAEAAYAKDMVLLVTPAQQLRANLRLLLHSVKAHTNTNTIFVCASKGIEVTSLKRMSEVAAEELPGITDYIAVLSGPNLSHEVAQEQPGAAVVAARNEDVAIHARSLLSTHTFRVYTSQDVIGVELGGALKNIIAIGTGINDGLGYGENARAAIITRGLAEMSRLGVAAGANPLTFAGLAGLGDLVATCASPLSRNRQLGLRLASGEKLDAILNSMHTVAEGVTTTRAALHLAARYAIEMPITKQLNAVLFAGLDPRQAVSELMMRDPKGELEGIF
jgi:glycerol-3-phosphate dehydrogenase (NAD(P)+)